MARQLPACLVVALGVLASSALRAESGAPGTAPAPTGSLGTPPADHGATVAKKAPPKNEKKLSWRGTSFNWGNRVTAQTLGIGADYQSANPYYEWFFSFRPRYYLWEDGDNTLSLRATVNAVTELTNSDSTTKRGEFVLDDSTLSLSPAFVLAKDGDFRTVLSLSAPRVVLPTSKASRAAGVYTEVGLGAGIEQGFPIRSGEELLPTGSVGFRTGYAYLFSRANVAEDPELNRLRRNVDGVTVPSGQLGGAALARHRASLHIQGSLEIWKDRLSFGSEGGVDVLWKSPLRRDEVVVQNGTAELEGGGEGRFQAVSYFNAELSVDPIKKILTVGLGYENVTPQIGPDGQRRNMLYSPDATVYLGVQLSLDAIYLEASGQEAPSEVASAR